MRYVPLTVFVGLLALAVASDQEISKATNEGRQALQTLLDACVAEGGLKAVESPNGKQLAVADEDKLRATVAGRPDLLTPALRDALVAAWDEGDETARPAYVALLQAYSQEGKDELGPGIAAYCAAAVAERRLDSPQALRLYKEAEQFFGTAKEPAWQARSLNNIGEVYADQGDYAKALDCFYLALSMYQKLYDGPHHNVASSLSNIAVMYRYRGEYGRALEYHRRALAMRQKLYNRPHEDVALSLNNIGSVYYTQGEHPTALDYFQRALAMYRKVYDGPHSSIARSFNNIALVYEDQGKYGEALEYHRRALAMRQKLFEEPHREIIVTLNNIGEAYRIQGEYGEALEYHRRALAMEQKLYDRPHPYVAASLNNIGLVYHDQEQFGQALDYLQRSLAMKQKLPDSPGGVRAQIPGVS
jgi:tetratricopeptide (TPR) repeat protein